MVELSEPVTLHYADVKFTEFTVYERVSTKVMGIAAVVLPQPKYLSLHSQTILIPDDRRYKRVCRWMDGRMDSEAIGTRRRVDGWKNRCGKIKRNSEETWLFFIYLDPE